MSEITFRASGSDPCPVCGTGTKGCSATADGLHLCRGEPQHGWRRVNRGDDAAGFGHYRRGGVNMNSGKAVRPKVDWPARAKECADANTPELRAKLAAALGLPADALDVFPLLGFHRADANGQCFTFPECDAAGRVVGLSRRYADGAKRSCKGSARGLSLPDGWRDRPGPVFVVEGPTDTAALSGAGLAAVGRPSNSGGAALLAELFRGLPPDRQVLVVGENDERDGGWPGRDGAVAVATGLAARLGRPVPWTLPPAGAKDVRAWLTDPARGESPWEARGAELATALLAAAEVIDPTATDAPGVAAGGPPEIVVAHDEHRVNDEAVAALATEPDVFQRGGLLVHVLAQPDEPDLDAVVRRPVGAPVVRELARPLLRERFTRVASWQQWRGSGENAQLVPAHPPDWSVAAVHARGDWPGVRRLDAIVTHPVLLPSGDLLTADGYHPGLRLLACLPPGLAVTVPDAPTRADVAAAVEVLLDPVVDFPFQTPAHRAAWVAGVLTPLAWFLFDGPAPLFLIDANTRGAGKGRLANVVALTVTGREFAVMSYTNNREELRKKITTLAMEGERLVLLDNLAGAVGNDVLDAALTSDRWKDRILGGHRVYDGPLHVVWFATGNNVQLHADTARRVCHIRMETSEERPEMKEGFRHSDLLGYVRRRRGSLLSAALTILRAWVWAGRPKHGLRPWGSFEGWSGVVREAVVYAGLPDPGETRVQLQTAADRDACAMADVLDGLAHLDATGRGVTTADIVARVRAAEREASPPEWVGTLRAAVEDLCGRLDGRALGYKFRHFQRRNFGGRALDKSDAPHGTNRWVVRPVAAAGGNHVHHVHHVHPPDRPGGGDGGHGGDDPALPGGARPAPRCRLASDEYPHDVRGDR